MKKDSQTSTCWNYFEKVEGGALCKLCNKVYTCFGNTSNIMKHLRRVHKDAYNSAIGRNQKNHNDFEDYEEIEAEGISPSEEEANESVAETNTAVHTIQAYRDVNGTTFVYLHPAPEGDANVQLQNAQLQPLLPVTTSETITPNGEIVSVAVQKDPSVPEGQAVVGVAKTQEDTTPKQVIHAPVKNYQGSSVAARALARQLNRPNPVRTEPAVNCNNNNNSNNNNSNKEDSFDAFGKYIASMLRNLPSKNACKLQGEIVNWILKDHIKNNC